MIDLKTIFSGFKKKDKGNSPQVVLPSQTTSGSKGKNEKQELEFQKDNEEKIEFDKQIPELHSSSDSPAEEYYTLAKQEYDKGNYESALHDFILVGFNLDIRYRPLYALAIDCFEMMEWFELDLLFKSLLADSSNPKRYFDIGVKFLEMKIPFVSITFLEYLYKFAPMDFAILVELSVAYSNNLQPEKAREILSKTPHLKEEFWLEYQYLWSGLLLGETQGVQEFIRTAKHALQNDGNAKEELSELNKMEEVYNRLISFGNYLPEDHIRDWQFIQYGSVILDYNGYVGDKKAYSLSGRYGDFWMTKEDYVGIIGKLVQFTTFMGVKFNAVVSTGSKDSQILGRTLALAYGVDFWMITEDILDQPGLLIVSSDSLELEAWSEKLFQVRNNQIVFCLNHFWTKPTAITADLIGITAKFCWLPWDKSVQADPLDGQNRHNPPDTRAPIEIAQDMLQTTTEKSPYFDDMFDFYLSKKDYLKFREIRYPIRLPFVLDSKLKIK
jgi:tetratricopeptide (TPR) repeat protein